MPSSAAGKLALLIVDVQNDFLAGGAVPVARGDAVIPVLNEAIGLFAALALPVFATRDWHPPNHCSFRAQGGTWTPHCVAGSAGAEFPAALQLPPDAIVVSKATTAEADACSGFQGTTLASQLGALGVDGVVVGGLATDYCVLATVTDALAHGFHVDLLDAAIRPVDEQDGEAAIAAMVARGAHLVKPAWLKARLARHPLPQAEHH